MVFLIQQTMLYAVPLMIVALAGVCAERSGIINLALEGIMIFGAFMGVVFIRMFQDMGFQKEQGMIVMLLAMLLTGICGILFSMLLAFSAINLKADQANDNKCEWSPCCPSGDQVEETHSNSTCQHAGSFTENEGCQEHWHIAQVDQSTVSYQRKSDIDKHRCHKCKGNKKRINNQCFRLILR